MKKTLAELMKSFPFSVMREGVCATCPFRKRCRVAGKTPLRFHPNDARAFILNIVSRHYMPHCHETTCALYTDLSDPKICRGALEFRRGGNREVAGTVREFLEVQKLDHTIGEITYWATPPSDWIEWKEWQQVIEAIVEEGLL